MGIFIIGMVEIFPSQTTQWGLEEFLKAFLYANIIPAFAFSLQVNVYHRLVFLLTFPLFFLYIAFFIIDNISSVYDSINESSGSLLKKIGSFAVLRLHNLSLLMGYLILLAGTFFELPWKLIWPALMTIPIGLIQIWQVNQILSGRKPNIQALVFTAVCIALFTAYFSILSLWLN
jgi:1,4-dihydroxy-2-naphthoate octaprenyltransferase